MRQGSQKKYLSPPEQINNEIDVILGARSLVKNERHITQSELAKFYQQVNDFLTVGSIRPTNPLLVNIQGLGRNTKPTPLSKEGDRDKPLKQHMLPQKHHPNG